MCMLFPDIHDSCYLYTAGTRYYCIDLIYIFFLITIFFISKASIIKYKEKMFNMKFEEEIEKRTHEKFKRVKEDSVPRDGNLKEVISKTTEAKEKKQSKKATISKLFFEDRSSNLDLDESTEYDEYEEDIHILRTLKPSRLKLLLRKWNAAQSKFQEAAVMTRYARTAEEKQEAASAAAEAEEIRLQMIKDMQEEIRLEKYNTEKQIVLEDQEAAMRDVQLKETWNLLHNYKSAFMEYVVDTEGEENWIRYMICDGLPDPGSLSKMNTFLFLWSMENEEININNIATKYDIVSNLLTKLEEIINFSITTPFAYIDECKAIKQRFRDKLREWIDAACYSLLRQIDRDMVHESIKTARYTNVSNQIKCFIWVLIKMPIALKQITDKDRKPVEVHFTEIDLTVKMPVDIDCYCMAIRVLWVKYDHHSDCSFSYFMPKLPDEYEGMYTTDFFTYCQNEYKTKLKIREEQIEGRRLRLEEKKAALERIENPPPLVLAKHERRGRQQQKVQLKRPEQEPEPLPYLPTPEELIIQREDEARKEIRKLLFTRCEKTEINLRKYRILGGVLYIDLIYQPPQPKDLKRNILLTTLQIPKKMEFVPFHRPYKAPPPAPDNERTPEIIEAEMKALEAAMEELVLVTLKLPSFIIWFEPPLVAHWISERKIWSTQDVHDIKYNEEKQTITFRSGRLGAHGLAAFKFINIPFQSWELKPEMGKNARGGIVLNVTAAIVQAEFIVREDLVCLNSLIGGTSTILKEITGQYMKLHLLIEKMRDAGCDLFPERDAFSYVKALPVKHSVTEKHLRECMALLCTAYTFSWSRWNANRSFREIVIQFKELHGCVAKERTNSTLLVTALRTTVINCTEVSSEFSDVPIEDKTSKFYADLYNLALQNAGIKSRLLMKSISFKLAVTVAELLGRTNVINMSS
ncbi:axonemal 84 kDa protein-like [Pseudomyrmex gracilis]|uniref:axonemal 84 kDa protein-like n=1 Tax=Pseudomyrmex gracilis TaxID=219809 RepID=UPI0009955E34|nr:axonemal 84 kDa protein-like [Pseudomyrmex gracilis]